MKSRAGLVLCPCTLLMFTFAGCRSHPTTAPAPIGLVGSDRKLAGQAEPRFAHLTQAQTDNLTPAEKADLAKDTDRLVYYSVARNCFAALKTHPNDMDAHFGVGLYDMGSHGNRTQAVREFRTVVKAQPDNRFASLLLARALMSTGHKTEAEGIDRNLAATQDGTGMAARRDLARMASH